jgi:hypothetical protein
VNYLPRGGSNNRLASFDVPISEFHLYMAGNFNRMLIKKICKDNKNLLSNEMVEKILLTSRRNGAKRL